MNTFIAMLLLLLLSVTASAEDRGKLIGEDRIDRNESQEATKEIGNG